MTIAGPLSMAASRRGEPRFSFVIPTIWAPGTSFVKKLVTDLSSHPLVGEVILVDNAPRISRGSLSLPKVLHLPQKRNVYVNPAWNIGVARAGCDFLALCNDDINLDWTILAEIAQLLGEESELGDDSPSDDEETGLSMDPIGLIGLGRGLGPQSARFEEVKERPFGYGMCLFLKRESFVSIPPDLKIWCGDDFLFDLALNRGERTLALQTDSLVLSADRESVSSGKRRFRSIKRKDLEDYSQNGARWVNEALS